MVSRDTLVHLAALAIGIGILAAWAAIDSDPMNRDRATELLGLALALAWYFVVFAGAHLYLAVRGEDGMVPASTRWRFVAAIGALLLLVGLGTVLTPADPLLGVRPAHLVFATAVAVFVGWFGYEVLAGYRERRPSG